MIPVMYMKGTLSLQRYTFSMIYEWPHPQIDEDWDNGDHQWREITPSAYSELKRIPLLYESKEAFMQAEPVDILQNGEGLYVCCRRADGYYFARLLPESDWWDLEQLPLSEKQEQLSNQQQE